MTKKTSARDKIRSYFEKNVGKVVNTSQIAKVAGISEYARRIRELRDLEGMKISSHLDRSDLKPGQYVLESLERAPKIESTIPVSLRNEILERNGYTCQHCGRGPGDVDPYNPNRKVRLHIDHIKPVSQGGTSDKDNLRVLCSLCNQTKANIQEITESAVNILARLRKQPLSVRREVYEALRRMFNDEKD